MTQPPRRTYAHSVAQIAELLASQIESLCQQLLPAGKRDGGEWRCGSIAGEPGQSLAVHLRPPRAGVWADFASADPRHRGDALDLVAAVLFSGDKVQAIRWARSWLGLTGADADHKTMATTRAQAPAKLPSERDDEGKRASAIKLWLDGSDSIVNTPAAAYLAGRGLDLAELRRVPRALRFHPQVWCAERQARLPAMLAAVTDHEGKHIATHRTYLEPGGPSGWRKASLKNAKKVLGGYVGGAIRLWRGASAKPWSEAPEDDVLAVAEGIEDTLTVALACPEWRCIAAVSVSNFANLVLPAQLLDVWLVCDRDGENAQADTARERATRRWMSEGRSVREARPPEGHKDFNAWWQAERKRGSGA